MARRSTARLIAGRRSAVVARRRGGFTVDMKVLGVPQYQKKINSLKLSVARRIVNKGLRQAAKRILQPAVDANVAMVSPGEGGSGKLKSFGTKVRRILRRKTGVQVQLPTRDDLNIPPDHPYYPAFLEFGNVKLGITAKRMLRRARNEREKRIIVFLRRSYGRLIRAEVRKLAQKGKSAFR